METLAAYVRTEDGESALEAAIGPSQYGHARLVELVSAWESRGATPRAKTIRRECARAALQMTGESFAQIGRRIQCTRAAISAGVKEFCKAHQIPNRVGRDEDTRRACRMARRRVLRGEVNAEQPAKLDALQRVLNALRGTCRKWIAQQCGVSHITARSWFIHPSGHGYRRPISLLETLQRLAARGTSHPVKTGRPVQKLAYRNSLTQPHCQKNF